MHIQPPAQHNRVHRFPVCLPAMHTLAAQNCSAAGTGPWRPDPTFRGTWGILSTCLSTLLICVWSAIHINIRPQRRKRLFLDKVPWMFIGLFIPGYLLLTAFSQGLCAWELSKLGSVSLMVVQPAAPQLTWLEKLCKWVGWGADSRPKVSPLALYLMSRTEPHWCILGDFSARLAGKAAQTCRLGWRFQAQRGSAYAVSYVMH